MSDLVERTLRSRVDRAEPALQEVAPERIVERARQVRRRRRAVATGVIGVVAAVAVGAGLTRTRPIDPVQPAGRAHWQSLDGSLTELPQGARPAIGYGYGGVLHLARGGSRPVPGSTTYEGWAQFSGGLLVQHGNRLGLYVDRLGTETRSVFDTDTAPTVSDRGRRAAWVAGPDAIVTARVVDNRAVTLTRWTVPGVLQTGGFLAGGVVVVTTSHGVETVGPGGLHTIPSLLTVTATNQATGLVSGELDHGFGVVDPTTGRVLVRSDQVIDGFSGDGRYVVTKPAGVRTTSVSVLDVRSGVVHFVQLDQGMTARAVRWEDDEHVLAVVVDARRHQQALVRFGVDGRIERATAVTRPDDGTYVLERVP